MNPYNEFSAWFLVNAFLSILDGILNIQKLNYKSSIKAIINYLETLLKQGKLSQEISDCVHQSILRGVIRGGLDSDDELVFQRMRYFVARKENVGILQQLAIIYKN